MFRLLVSIGIVQVLIMLVSLGRSKILSVLLGPAAFGIVSTIDQTVITVVQLGALSLPFTAMKFMARSHSEGHEVFQRTFANFFQALGVLAVGAVALITALLTWQPDLFGGGMAPYLGLMYVAMLGAPAMILQILFVNTLAAAQKTSASAGLNFLVTFALAVAAIVGVLLHGIGGMYAAMAITGLLATVAALRYLGRNPGVSATDGSSSFFHELRHNKEIVSYSALLYVAMSAYSLTMLATRFFVLTDLGEVGAGLLQALMSLALTAGAVLAPMNNLYLTPLVNRQMPAASKVSAANDFASKVILLLVLVTLPAVLFPQLALTVLFSGKFAPAASALFLFVFWQCLYSIVNIYLQLLIGLDEVWFFTLVTCVSYGCAGLLFPLLVPTFGLGGIAIGLTSAMLVSGVAALLRLRLKFASGISLSVWLRIALCLSLVLLAGIVFDVSSETTLLGVVGRAAYGLAVVALLGATLSRQEREMLRGKMAILHRRHHPVSDIEHRPV